jgi:hypothetical protein
VALAAITWASCRRLRRRRTPLPPIGDAAHVTTVLRLPSEVVPLLDVGPRHHRYPPHTVHVTVANLDESTVDIESAVASLQRRALDPVSISIEGIGCSPDTLFLRCVYGPALAALRAEVRQVFGLGRPSRRAVGALFSQLTFANVVRFDGAGTWPGRGHTRATVELRALEVVRTDRYLSDAGTTVLARIPLEGEAASR